jgi:hypothetical protein
MDLLLHNFSVITVEAFVAQLQKNYKEAGCTIQDIRGFQPAKGIGQKKRFHKFQGGFCG